MRWDDSTVNYLIKFTPRLVIVLAIILLAMVASPLGVPVSASTPSPTPTSWIISNLPPDATQLQRGAEIYRLVCSACHAYDGTGLTDQWRSTWDPSDQNCWQSKCHAENHPEEGFSMPVAPPVVGPVMPARFTSAAALHAFISAAMPWQRPQSLTLADGWAVTAYIMKLNGMAPPDNLNELNAPQISINSNVTIDPALKVSVPPGAQKNLALPTPGTLEPPAPSAGAAAQVAAHASQPTNSLTIKAVIGASLLVLLILVILLIRKKR